MYITMRITSADGTREIRCWQSDGRLLLFVQTRTLLILSTWTASDYSTMHCSALYTVLTVIICS